MNNGMLGKFATFKGFLNVVRQLGAIFEGADRKALNAAFKAGDFKAVCTALHVNQAQLTSLIQQGGAEAAKIAKDEPDIAVAALKQPHPANGSRP